RPRRAPAAACLQPDPSSQPRMQTCEQCQPACRLSPLSCWHGGGIGASPDSMREIAMTASGLRSRRVARLVLTAVTSASVVAGLTVSSPVQAETSRRSQPDQRATVEQAVRAELTSDGTADFWVYLEPSADLSATPSTSRAAQGEFVYDALTDTADRSQAELKAMLEGEGTAYESFWIANTIKVTGGDRALLEQITALPGVSHVTADRSYPLVEPEPAQPQAASGA